MATLNIYWYSLDNFPGNKCTFALLESIGRQEMQVQICNIHIMARYDLKIVLWMVNMFYWFFEIVWKLRDSVWRSAWMYHQWISQLKYMHFDSQYVEIGPKIAEIAKIAWNCMKIDWRSVWKCVKLRIQHALAEPVPTIPQTPQMDLTRLRNQCGQTQTDRHMLVFQI